ncbi:acyltransferase family protein [Granulosicoccus antarcticus]|uniref:Acyltransferase 3 domain-containing protein n=1 Tax=Granulosicoccus antarcticus IMCC3135 TaxID=1192854 RepID=A0A2Z2NW51_9GAMM|nr:acyltransferase family protein [Granulosicoccus antarcticus]ASJ71384.1 hypothetical protein IMCC3135_06385 [Granulosicoccus antarcticus IMCC3135]
MSELVPQIQLDTRERIAMARMLCVLCMIFVHVPDGQSIAQVYSLTTGGFAIFLEGFLVEGPGRASAALLSVVSGYLAATTLLKPGSSVWSLYRRRFVSIILPMIFWACVTYVVYLVVSQSRPTFLEDAKTVLDKLNIIFFITEMPLGATMHLGFLRDLFVCVLLSPLLLLGIRRMAWFVLPMLGMLYVFEHNQSFVLILRPLVLFAFSIGIYLAVRGARLDALDRLWPVFVMLSIIATMIILLANSGVGDTAVQAFAKRGLEFDETVLYPFGRLFGSLAIWTLLPWFLGGKLQIWVKRFTPYLFAAFCSHYLMLTLLFYGGWSPLFGGRQSDSFIIWFLSAPLVSMAVAVMVVTVAQWVAPPLATLITGGRLKTAKAGASVDALGERRKQGVAVGGWLILASAYEAVSGFISSLVRGWFEASRRLLLGRAGREE